MLRIGRGLQRTCHGATRREFIQVGASSLLGLSLADLLRLRGKQLPGWSVRAVIFIWLWGGPAQLDTWDPKPNAPLEFRGPFASIPTRTTGVRVTELFPQIASIQDKFAIVRSLFTSSNDHGVAGTIGLTGSSSGSVNLGGSLAAGSVRPATGSVVSRAQGLSSRPTAVYGCGRQIAPGQEGDHGRRGRGAGRFTIHFDWSTILKPARVSPLCNFPRTSRPKD